MYNEIDVLVIPSLWYETYVLVKHEAFIREIPVIAADIGALEMVLSMDIIVINSLYQK